MTIRSNHPASIPTTNADFGSRRLPRVAPWLALTLLAASVGSAWAQSAPSTDASASSPDVKTANDTKADATTLEAVTVSATRRPEAIRDVPVAITKISTDAQLDLGAKDLGDILSSVPGVSYNRSTTAGTGDIVIRGVSTGVATNPAVGVYIDDVPVGAASNYTSGFDQRLLDLANIEVLKGPQGTLYGASAMGGVLKYNTRSPDADSFSGLAGGEVSSTQDGGLNHTLYGNVNVPLKEGVAAFRVAVFSSKDGGYLDATGPAAGKDVNSGTVNGARLSLALKPSDALDIRLSAQTQDARYDGQNVASYDANSQPIAGALTRTDLRYPEPNRTKNDLTALNIEYDLGWAKAYSITGYQTQRFSAATDFNDGYLKILPPFVTETFFNASNQLDKTTQEFRLVSRSGGTIEWLVGAFYDNEKTDSDTLLTASTTPGAPFPNGAALYNHLGVGTHWRETAFYGTVVWNVTPALALTAGTRVSRDSQSFHQRDLGLITTNHIYDFSTEDSPETYLAAARYKLTPSASVYARDASGYRAGGANLPQYDAATGQTTTAVPYKSDSLWNYEVGYKADLPNDLGGIDVALFQIDWRNLQTYVLENATSVLGNAAKARIRGIELGGVLRPMRAVTVRASATFMDPKLTEDSPGLGGKAGDRLPISPKVAASVNARYDFSAVGAPSFAALNLGYTGNRTSSFDGNLGTPNYKLPAYTTLDINGGVFVAGCDLGLYVRNLTDSHGQVSSYGTLAGLGGPTWVNILRPRTIGVTLSRAF
jgi:outer membrane receptor protein involved in Fe transport